MPSHRKGNCNAGIPGHESDRRPPRSHAGARPRWLRRIAARHPCWPRSAKIDVNFCLNIEGGGESSLANGDAMSEGMLNDIGVPAKRGVRVPLVESVFEH